MKVGIIDYGVGNLKSIHRSIESLGAKSLILDHSNNVSEIDSLILPGVGSFSECVNLLRQSGWEEAIKVHVESGRPLLGICLGMQLLATSGTEGCQQEDAEAASGLDLISGKVEKLSVVGSNLRIPHVGWNSISPTNASDRMFSGIPSGTDFYFVHSYAFVPDDPGDVSATADYGTTFTAAIQKEHVWGTQFHPEKSSRAGFALLKNFLEIPGC